MPELNVDTSEMVELITRTDAAASKFNGGLEFLESELNKIQADSEQSREFKGAYTHIITESREGILTKIQHSSKVLDEFRQQIVDLEGNPNIFAEALGKKSEAERASRALLRS